MHLNIIVDLNFKAIFYLQVNQISSTDPVESDATFEEEKGSTIEVSYIMLTHIH